MWLWAILGFVAGGCDRTHMSATYGRDVRRALRTQVIDTHAGEKARATQGLDPEEAAIVLQTYRKSLSPSGDEQAAQRAPVLLLPPNVAPPQAGPVPGPGEYR